MEVPTWLVTIAITLVLLDPSSAGDQFPIYWNIPLETCTARNVTFDLDKYGIIHNQNNTFHGDKVNIWYKPGKFPYLKGSKFTPVNGGIPMNGDIKDHVESFLETLRANIHPEYSGISVLDFEEYGPIYDNYVTGVYRNASRAWVRDLLPDLPPQKVEEVAKSAFEAFAIPYFQVLLDAHKSAYPKSLTGYYHYPYCSNGRAPYTQCTDQRKNESDALQNAVFETSTALFPSIYIFKRFGADYDTYVETALQETKRVNTKKLPILPYFWYRYHEENTFLPKKRRGEPVCEGEEGGRWLGDVGFEQRSARSGFVPPVQGLLGDVPGPSTQVHRADGRLLPPRHDFGGHQQ